MGADQKNQTTSHCGLVLSVLDRFSPYYKGSDARAPCSLVRERSAAVVVCRAHHRGMDPITLFHLLRGKPMGLQLFRAAVRLRCWGRLAASWALSEWVEADLPGRGWAMRQRLEMELAWQADRSRMRYLRALLTDQPS